MRLVWLGLIALLSACTPLELLKKEPSPAPAPIPVPKVQNESAACPVRMGTNSYYFHS